LYGDPYEAFQIILTLSIANKVDTVSVNQFIGVRCIVVSDVKIALLEALVSSMTMDDEIPLPLTQFSYRELLSLDVLSNGAGRKS
jgi:hypothetical protein